MAQLNTADFFERRVPRPQNILDLFLGQWLSDVPGYGYGHAGLFADARIDWLRDQCGGFEGKTILELGPLEGGHTFMMASAGADDIIAIESNSRAFLRCLVLKEILKYKAEFLLGDFVSYLEDVDKDFDFILCSGVIYHMHDPLRLLQGVAARTSRVGIWTHYFDQQLIAANAAVARHFAKKPDHVMLNGQAIELWPQRYEEALQREDFAGGMETGSRWLTKAGLIRALDILGFRVTLGTDYTNHQHGPAIMLYAEKF